MIDADGSGGIAGSEVKLFLICALLHTCDECAKAIHPFVDEGYRCEACYTGARCAPLGEGTDLCSTCMGQGKGCAHHGTLFMKASSSVSDGTTGNRYPAHPIQRSLDVLSGNKSLTCMSCGEAHDIVLSYLEPGEMDFHMLPVQGKWGPVQRWGL